MNVIELILKLINMDNMNKRTEIKIPSTVKYLSEIIPELPKDCLFDKGITGCGGTTVAINSKANYVICVPFVSLIDNKWAQHRDILLGVHSDVDDQEIEDYLAKPGVKKIMCTYDSLPRLNKFISTDRFNLLIDEYHILFKDYSFRKDAVQAVLTNYTLYKSFCFMTATPLEDDFLLDELRALPVVEAVWEDSKVVTIYNMHVKKSILSSVAVVVERFLSGKVPGNCYLFVNSITMIKDIIRKCELDETNCRVIYSKHNPVKLSIPRGEALDPPKKINILTSVAFEGCDIFDEDGRTFIVSDIRKVHTLNDISTSLPQIAGRIRNSKFYQRICHIFTTSLYKDGMTYDEFKQETEEQTKASMQLAEDLSALPETALQSIKEIDNPYLTREGFKVVFDPNKVKIDLYNFKICNCLYSLRVNVTKEMREFGYDVQDYTLYDEFVKVSGPKKDNFKQVVDKLEELGDPMMVGEEYDSAFSRYPFLKEAIAKIGYNGIRDKGYVINTVKRDAVKILDSSVEVKVARLLVLTARFKPGMFIHTKDAKDIISKIYRDLNVGAPVSIKTFYNVKPTVKRVGDVLVRGYIILMPKIG